MFAYLLDKLSRAEFRRDPFPHVYVSDFLTPGHFAAAVSAPEIALPSAADTGELFDALSAASYEAIQFPGCTKNRSEYVAWLEAATKPKRTHGTCEAKGMALRCTTPRTDVVQALDEFFHSDELHDLLIGKFDISKPVALDAGIQKYLHGYEISPHVDIRRKALTWMLNINPGIDTEAQGYHTHYMRFRPEWRFVQDFWRDTPTAETCWVPWQWCETANQQTANNSIVLFSPRHDTLHAVKAHYDHLPAQRTQLYGNLWYAPKKMPWRPEFGDFAGGSAPRRPRRS